MHKLTQTTLTLHGLSRCILGKKRSSASKFISRGFACVEHVDDSGKNEVYDVIISGGGMVGSAMACSLGELRLPSYSDPVLVCDPMLLSSRHISKKKIIRSLHVLKYVQRNKMGSLLPITLVELLLYILILQHNPVFYFILIVYKCLYCLQQAWIPTWRVRRSYSSKQATRK